MRFKSRPERQSNGRLQLPQLSTFILAQRGNALPDLNRYTIFLLSEVSFASAATRRNGSEVKLFPPCFCATQSSNFIASACNKGWTETILLQGQNMTNVLFTEGGHSETEDCAIHFAISLYSFIFNDISFPYRIKTVQREPLRLNSIHSRTLVYFQLGIKVICVDHNQIIAQSMSKYNFHIL